MEAEESNITADNNEFVSEDDEVTPELYLYKDDADAAGIVTEYVSEEEPLDGSEPAKEKLNASAVEHSKDNREETLIDLPSDGASVVEFYAPWCPHCRHAKPLYIETAKEVRRRAIGVRVHFLAVSCEAHAAVCTRYEIDGYPTLRIFPQPDATRNETRNETSVGEDIGMDADEIAEFLGIEFAQEELREIMVMSYENDTERMQAEETMARDSRMAADAKRKEHEYPRPVHQVYYDAGTSLVYALRGQIYTSPGALPARRKAALQDCIEVFSWALPQEWSLNHQLLSTLKRQIHSISQTDANLQSLLRDHAKSSRGLQRFSGKFSFLPPSNASRHARWTAQCSHDVPAFGYTCGLWELFHAVTVGAAERTRDSPRFAPNRVADTLRDFVENFFACDVCRANFLAFYDNCGADRCARLQFAPEQLPLWLWQAHNEVNVRIAKEAAERAWRNVTKEETDAALWPTKNMCQACWRDDGSWDEDVVYEFLKHQYWPTDKAHPSFSHEIDPIDTDIPSNSPRSIVCFLLASIVLGLFLQQWLFRRHLKKSGRHKKEDDRLIYHPKDQTKYFQTV